MIDHYTYRVDWSNEDEEWVGLCAEFPSLSWLSPVPDAALSGIQRLVAEIRADMQDAGDTFLEPLVAGNLVPVG